jgi:PAS domain S-box-containing protein
MKTDSSKRSPFRSASKIALLYAAISLAYILFSDHLLGLYAIDAQVMTRIGMLKGWVFVLTTALLIFFLLRREIRKYSEAEQALHESESRLQAFSGATFEGIVFSLEGRVLDCNAQFAGMLGYSRSELPGKQLSDLIAPDARSHVSDNFALNREDVFEHDMIRKDGSYLTVEAHGKPVVDSERRTRCTAVRDITERKQIEKALLESESKYRRIVENTSEAIMAVDDQKRVTLANQRMADMLGYALDEIVGQRGDSFFFKEDLPDHAAKMEARRRGESAVYERRFRRKDGSTVWVIASATPIMDLEGHFRGAFGMYTDITARKQAENQLQEANRRLDFLVTESPAVVFTYDLGAEPNITYVSRNIETIIGWKPETFVDHFAFWLECLHPDDLARVRSGLEGLKTEGRAVLEYRFKDIDGNYHWLHDEQRLAVHEASRMEVIGAWWDVTETKRIESKLDSLGEQLQGILRHSPLPISILDTSGRFLMGNTALCSLLKIPEDSLPGKSVFDFVPEEVAKRHLSLIQQVHETGKPETINEKLTFHDLDHFFRSTLFPLRGWDGRNDTVGVISVDITVLESAQAELKRLAAAIEHAAETVVVTDAAGNIQYVNPAFESETGYRREEALGQNPRLLKSGKHDDSFYRDMWNTLLSGGTWQGHLVNKRKDGRLYTEKARISPVRDASGAISNFVAVKHDITRELELEQGYREGQKMQAVGTLAAGIAHDFNNILGLILGHAEMMQLSGAVAGHATDSVRQILLASTRAKGLVKQILNLSRRGKQEKIPLNLRPLIRESSEFLQSSLPANIQLVIDLDPEAGRVLADPGLIQQVVVNICTNAFQSMEKKGGVLAIRLTNTTAGDEKGLVVDEGAPTDFVKISISDTGTGIEPGVMERIFEPYFTTRAVGQGQGLGLAVAHGIISSHGGAIKVSSRVGEGSTFNVFLPRIKENQKADVTLWQQLPTGKERILFLDDEKALARVGELTLGHLGYGVTSRSSPVEAFEFVRSNPEAIDLVITDLTMPQLTGLQLAADLLRIRPDLPIILCTGYTERIDVQKARIIGIREVLIKPVAIRDLAAAVRKVLDSKVMLT